MAKVLVKELHMHQGLDLIGAKTSVSARLGEIEATPLGAKVTSKKTGRVILIPWANVKGCELLPMPKEKEPKESVQP